MYIYHVIFTVISSLLHTSYINFVTYSFPPCPALPYPTLPCPALPCLALPCPALLCPALPFLIPPNTALHNRNPHAHTSNYDDHSFFVSFLSSIWQSSSAQMIYLLFLLPLSSVLLIQSTTIATCIFYLFWLQIRFHVFIIYDFDRGQIS